MKFVTLFEMENVHITKDVGLIPYGMHEYYNYDAYCASYDNGPYVSIDTVCKGLKMWFVKRKTGNFKIDSLLFLMKHAKEIDVLNVYHIGLDGASKILIYKIFNSNGKVYWKLDTGVGGYNNSGAYKRFICRMALKKCCIVSTELNEYRKSLEDEWKLPFIHVRNPYEPGMAKEFCEYKNRTNTILTVGLLGSEAKATEVLLEAFKRAVNEWGLKGWELKLVGPIEKTETDFEKYISGWYHENPDMKSLVHFTGPIHDRKLIYYEYCMAKVFAFPSRHEGYSLALIEAAISGCFIIASDIPCSREMTDWFQYAASFPIDDAEQLAGQLYKWCMDEKEMEGMARQLYECVKRKNSLYEICSIIQEKVR